MTINLDRVKEHVFAGVLLRGLHLTPTADIRDVYTQVEDVMAELAMKFGANYRDAPEDLRETIDHLEKQLRKKDETIAKLENDLFSKDEMIGKLGEGLSRKRDWERFSANGTRGDLRPWIQTK